MPPEDVPQLQDTAPPQLADDVDPDLGAVVLTFDQPMMDLSWSVQPLRRGGEWFPDLPDRPHYDASRRQCTIPVRLEAGRVYWIWVNSPIHRYFMTDDYRRAAPRALLFATRTADGEPTPIPTELIECARREIGRAHV